MYKDHITVTFNFDGAEETHTLDTKIPQDHPTTSYLTVFPLHSTNPKIDTINGRGRTLHFMETIINKNEQKDTEALQVMISREEIKGYCHRDDLRKLLPYIPVVA